jgi:hypothetical protein
LSDDLVCGSPVAVKSHEITAIKAPPSFDAGPKTTLDAEIWFLFNTGNFLNEIRTVKLGPQIFFLAGKIQVCIGIILNEKIQ